ncbi:hypothetical protein C1280_27075 [Gemmata obscuriglobus]|uniref:Lipoprotein SmpA/OmlA domain-containing protein n=1 Tax=Gemmata obscuriglobus TaxID=114 RepID=A0A2Z3HEX1_9BACT|nr:hypothetical protein C1280_27075 [Gemmata obscuriglobus]
MGLPWSEGTATKKLIGLTDDEVKALLGKPNSSGLDTDGIHTLWIYWEPKWLKPTESSIDRSPTGMFIQLKDGIVRGVQRRPN